MASASAQVPYAVLSPAEIQAIYNGRFEYAQKYAQRVRNVAFKYGLPFVSGKPATPEKITTGDYFAAVKGHLHGTMTYTATAAVAAPTPTSKGMLALVDNLAIVGQNQITPCSIPAFNAEQNMLLDKKADYVSTQVFPMPAAFAAAGSVAETCDCWMEFPITQDFIDLLGIQNINNDNINITVAVNWGTETAAVNMANGLSASFSGVLDLYAVRFTAPLANQPGPDFTKFFNSLSVVRDQSMNTVNNVVNINYKNWITRLVVNVFTSADNLDSGNSLGVQSITLTASSGKYVLLQMDLDELIDENRKRFGPQFNTLFGDKGVYVLDFEEIRDYIDGEGYTDLVLTVKTSAVTAGATMDVYLQGITNTDPQIPTFM